MTDFEVPARFVYLTVKQTYAITRQTDFTQLSLPLYISVTL